MKKIFAGFLSAVMIVAALAGCKNNTETVNQNASEVILNGDKIYPVQCEDTLTYWMTLTPSLGKYRENFGETALAKELEKRTGIKVEYIHGQRGQEPEQFSILMASNDLPDICQTDWSTYPGGIDQAVKDKYTIDLNTVAEYMPAFNKFFREEHPEHLKKIQGATGVVVAAPCVRGESWMATHSGLLLREDWLRECGLQLPKTVDEYENVLKEFKTKYNCIPLTMLASDKSYIMYAYGIAPDFYHTDGTVMYGYAQPEYKEVLKRLKKWYDEGIMHPDFTLFDTAAINKKMLLGETGSIFGAAGGSIAAILNAEPTKNDPDFKLVAGPCLTLDGSEIAEFGRNSDLLITSCASSISETCKNYELAARFLDYGYTEEGGLLYNFGIEGVSYNMVDGEPVLSDLILNNPEGKSIGDAAVEYMKSSYNGSFIHDARYVEQSLVYEEQLDGYQKWSKNNMLNHLLPPLTLPADEVDESADIAGVIKTYVDEMTIKFIIGTESLDNFDAYLAQIEKFGLSRLLEIKQNAYNRYLGK